MRLDRHRLDETIALDDAEHDHLAGCALAALTLAGPAKRGFVAFDGASEGLAQFLLQGQHGAHDAMKRSIAGRLAGARNNCR